MFSSRLLKVICTNAVLKCLCYKLKSFSACNIVKLGMGLMGKSTLVANITNLLHAHMNARFATILCIHWYINSYIKESD